MIFKDPPHRANKLFNHLIWVHNNQKKSIACSCKIVCRTIFFKRAYCGIATCYNCLLWYVLSVPSVEQNTSQQKDKWILPLPLAYAKWCCSLLKTLRASPAVLSIWLLQKYFSHPSLLMYSFATPPIKLKLGQQMVGEY
jgi:hypothetical protein